MGKNGLYFFIWRLDGQRFLGGIFGEEIILSLPTENLGVLGGPFRKLVTVSFRNIDLPYIDSLYNEILN
jgi:hypothetical protein